MGSRSFNILVVLFWLTSMSWLVIDKVLPPLLTGNPPDYRAIIGPAKSQPMVCWTIHWNDRPLGWAATKLNRVSDGMAQLRSRVFIGKLPMSDMFGGLLGLALPSSLDIEAQNLCEIDPLGRLVSFRSKLMLADIPDAITMNGQIDGSQLKLSVQCGAIRAKTEKYLPFNPLVGDEFSPQAELPGLRMGQNWTMPFYSPFRDPQSPIEILQATVEREDQILWNNSTVPCLVVVYRSDSGAGLQRSGESKARLWVAHGGKEIREGAVLKQEITVFNSSVLFVRLSEAQSERLARRIGGDLENGPSGARIMRSVERITAGNP